MSDARTASLAGLMLPAGGGNDGMMEVAYWTVVLVAAVLVVLISWLLLRRFRKNRPVTRKMDATFLDNLRTALSPDEMKRVREAMLRKYVEGEKNKEDTVSVKDLQRTAQRGVLTPPASPKTPASPDGPGFSSSPRSAADMAATAASLSRPVSPSSQAADGEPARPNSGGAPMSDARRISSGKVRYGTREWDEKAKTREVTSLQDILVGGGGKAPEKPKPPMEPAKKELLAPKGEAAVKMKPVDVDMLLQHGLITDQEYKRLKGYFEEEKK